ncbi:MAG: hypothetical protein KGJ13_06415 [Patescibacteria group bacterium]|nr:hypothetical protein [Patescibacteria group bacterium]
MQIRIGFTLMPGSQGWQFPPIQFLRTIETAEMAGVDDLRKDLQAVMDYADSILTKYKKPDTQDQLTMALQLLTKQQKQKKLPK